MDSIFTTIPIVSDLILSIASVERETSEIYNLVYTHQGHRGSGCLLLQISLQWKRVKEKEIFSQKFWFLHWKHLLKVLVCNYIHQWLIYNSWNQWCWTMISLFLLSIRKSYEFGHLNYTPKVKMPDFAPV